MAAPFPLFAAIFAAAFNRRIGDHSKSNFALSGEFFRRRHRAEPAYAA
jgi:hypothetical protein